MGLSYPQTMILEAWVIGALYGIYVVIFCACLYILMSRERRSTVKRGLIFVTVALFALSTALAITAFVGAFLTTDMSPLTSAPGETGLILQQKDIYNLSQAIIIALTATVNPTADTLLIWRCYIVWGRNTAVIIIPIMMLVAGTVCGWMSVYINIQLYLLRLHAPLSEILPPLRYTQLTKMYYYTNIVYYATSLVTNVVMTLLIACRIWWIVRDLQNILGRSHGKQYTRVLSVIIESGAAYSACLLLAVFTSSGLIDDYIFYSLVAMGAGIFPTLLVILVGLGKTTEPTTLATNGILDRPPAPSHIIESAHFEAEHVVRTQAYDIESQIDGETSRENLEIKIEETSDLKEEHSGNRTD